MIEEQRSTYRASVRRGLGAVTFDQDGRITRLMTVWDGAMIPTQYQGVNPPVARLAEFSGAKRIAQNRTCQGPAHSSQVSSAIISYAAIYAI
jgi:hypothetical protein